MSGNLKRLESGKASGLKAFIEKALTESPPVMKSLKLVHDTLEINCSHNLQKAKCKCKRMRDSYTYLHK